MKIFLGIDASNLILKKDQLKKLKIGLHSKNVEHRFEPHEQWYITLLSLGDVEPSVYEEKEVYIKNIVLDHLQFDLKLQGVSAYPEIKDARVLWIGVQNTKELRALQADLVQQISAFCSLEFKPTLPIVRLRNHKNVLDIISPYKNLDFGKLKVETVKLYEMISGGAYPVFKILKTYYLSIPMEDSLVVG